MSNIHATRLGCDNRASFTVFQNLNLGNASANPKWHLTVSWAISCQYQCVCKISSQQSTQFGHFYFFRIWSSAQPRPMLNVILQSLWLELAVPITIFHSVQEIGHFHFFRIWSSAKPRPMKNVISQSLRLDLVNINVCSKVYQNIQTV